MKDMETRNRIDHELARATGRDATMIRYSGNRLLLELAIGRQLTSSEADKMENLLRRVKPIAFVQCDNDISPVEHIRKICIQD